MNVYTALGLIFLGAALGWLWRSYAEYQEAQMRRIALETYRDMSDCSAEGDTG